MMTCDVNKETWSMFKQVLTYFANRTQPTFGSVCPLLSKHSLEKDFTRAILYPLYCDQDAVHKLLEELNPEVCLNPDLLARVYASEYSTTYLPATATLPHDSSEPMNSVSRLQLVDEQKKCNYCGKKSDELKKCTRCWKTRYCGKECQTKDWKEHKIICKPSTVGQPDTQPATELPVKCSNCGRLPNETTSLKRCAKCQSAAYCTKECQRNDWARHKLTCTATK